MNESRHVLAAVATPTRTVPPTYRCYIHMRHDTYVYMNSYTDMSVHIRVQIHYTHVPMGFVPKRGTEKKRCTNIYARNYTQMHIHVCVCVTHLQIYFIYIPMGIVDSRTPKRGMKEHTNTSTCMYVCVCVCMCVCVGRCVGGWLGWLGGRVRE